MFLRKSRAGVSGAWVAGVALGVGLLWAFPARGVVKNFSDPNGGPFQDAANWNPAGIPLATDQLVFNQSDSGYIVSFTGSATAVDMQVLSDVVTFDLNAFTLTLTGPQATRVLGGGGGVGRLTVSDGTLDSDAVSSTSVIGNSLGGASQVTVSTGGTWNTAQLNVGPSGNGTINITNGGHVNSTGALLGNTVNSLGTVNVSGTGSTWALSGNINVGSGGDGVLTVGAGGQLTAATMAVGVGDTGRATVSGSGATMTLSNDLTVGESTQGTFNVSNLGQVSVADFTTVGVQPGVTGTLEVGSNATFTTDQLSVGVQGIGILNVSASGDLITNNGTDIGNNVTSVGTLTVRESGSSWNSNGNEVDVGVFGSGSLIIERNGSATLGIVTLGSSSSGVGQLTVRTNGDLTTGNLLVGGLGNGSVSVEAGASLTSANVALGSSAASQGTATLTGPGASWTTGNLTVGGATSGATAGVGFLTVNPGATLTVGAINTLRVTGNGRFDLNGGTVSTGNFIVNAGGLFNFNSGTLEITGASGATVGGGGPFGTSLRLGPSQRLGATNNLTVAADAFVRLDGGALTSGANLINNGDILLEDPGALLSGATVVNNGLLRGRGRIGGRLNNQTAGEVRVSSGERLTFAPALASGFHFNGGRLNLLGGEIDFVGSDFRNDGAVNGRGLLRARTIFNGGQIQLSAGVSDVFGPVNNLGGGSKVIVSGGGTATFYDVFNNGGGSEFRVSENSTAVFFAPFSNAGTISGSGTKIYEVGPSPLGPVATLGSTVVGTAAMVSVSHIRETALTVEGDFRVNPDGTSAGTSRLKFLTIAGAPGAWTGQLDLTDNDLVIDYTIDDQHPTSPGATLRQQIASGYNGGAWTGNGITSSAAAADPSTALGYGEASSILGLSGGDTGTFSGQTVDATTFLIRYTKLGDANLDGSVSFPDLVALAQNYNTSDGSATWERGDFNFDGNVGFPDLVALAQNYNTSLPGPIGGATVSFNDDLVRAMAQVPEPGGLTLLAIVSCVIASRRR